MPLSDANITIAELETCTLDLTLTDHSSFGGNGCFDSFNITIYFT